MRTPRNFSLVNSGGYVLNLLTTSILLYDPTGLGFDTDDIYRQVGNRFIFLGAGAVQQRITGKVGFFGDDPYEAYFQFVQFCDFAPLTLIYTPNPAGGSRASAKQYRRHVRLARVDKAEINHDGYLEVPVEFACLDPWHKIVNVTNNPSDDDVTASFEWDLNWPDPDEGLLFGAQALMTVIVESDSHEDSPCRLEIFGPITNPSWTHYVNGIEYSTGSVECIVAADQVLVIDNTSDPYEIALYTAEARTFISNEYQNSDFSTKRFVDLQYGTNQIRIASEDTSVIVPVGLEARISYASV